MQKEMLYHGVEQCCTELSIFSIEYEEIHDLLTSFSIDQNNKICKKMRFLQDFAPIFQTIQIYFHLVRINFSDFWWAFLFMKSDVFLLEDAENRFAGDQVWQRGHYNELAGKLFFGAVTKRLPVSGPLLCLVSISSCVC